MANNTDMSQIVDLNGIAKVREWVKSNFLLKKDASEMMASKLKIEFGDDFLGQQYIIAGGAAESYTGLVPESLIVTQSIKEMSTEYNINCTSTDGTAYERTVNVGNYYGIYPCEFISFLAYLVVKADAGATITATGSKGKTYIGQADNTGYCTLNVGVADTYAVTATLNGETTKPVSATITTSGDSYECTCPSLLFNPVPFATGTDEEIAAMMDAAKSGSIDLQADGGWAVGDVRSIQVGAFTGGGSAANAAQTIDIVITSFEDYNQSGSVMQFDFKDELATGVRMNASNTNSGGYKASEMYTTTLPALVKALPTWLSERLLEFSVLASAGATSSTIETITGNKLALRSEIEIFGAVSYSKAGEGTQIEYYKTAANRVKKRGHSGSASGWWERSPFGSYGAYFCYVNSDGSASNSNASNAYGVAPFGCI